MMRISATFLCLVLAVLPAQAAPRETVPVDGEPFDAELVAVDADWQITFCGTSDGRTRQLPADALVRWGHAADLMRGPVLVLADGGMLVAAVNEGDREKLVANANLFGPLTLPLAEVAAVVFQVPGGRHARDVLFDRVQTNDAHRDEAILTNGDVIGGRFRRLHNGGLQNGIVELETDVGPLEFQSDRVRALVFNPTRPQPAAQKGLCALAGFSDGSRVTAKRLVADGPSLALTTTAEIACKTAVGELVLLQPLGGRATYLSDLEPAGSRQIAFLDVNWPAYRRDRNIAGGLLRCDGEVYLKGLGVHSADRLTYDLGKSYRRFDARLGIDDSTAGQGSVRFRVYVDGRQQFASPTVRGGDRSTPITVDTAGAARIDLVVDYADRADVQDRANWLEARLVK